MSRALQGGIECAQGVFGCLADLCEQLVAKRRKQGTVSFPGSLYDDQDDHIGGCSEEEREHAMLRDGCYDCPILGREARLTAHMSEAPDWDEGLDWRERLAEGSRVRCWHDGRWRRATVFSLCGGSATLQIEDGGCGLLVSLPLASADLQPAIADRAMSLAQLHRFAEDCRREIAEKGILDPREFVDREGQLPNPGYNKLLDFDKAPMWLVVELFVAPATRERRAPFVDLMAERWPDLGGPSTTTHFVSHSWGQYFSEDLHALKCVGEGARLWICCFAMTQDASRLELLDDSEVFAEALTAATTRYQVLIVDKDASALSRLWVLFEVLRAHEHGKPLCIAPPEALVKSRLTFSSIQLENAHAAVPADKAYILEQFEKVGLARVNETVINAVRSSLTFLLEKMKARWGSKSEEVANAHRYLGTYLLCVGGHARESERHYRQALAIFQQLHGANHLAVAQSYSDLGSALYLLGQYKEAERIHNLALKIRRGILDGDNHLEIAQCLGDLGLVYERLGLNREAERKHRRALEIRSEILGENSLKVAMSCFNLGTVVCPWDPTEALDLHRRALRIRHRILGGSDSRTAQSMSNVAHVLWILGRLSEAEAEFQRALAVMSEQLPRTHPQLAQVYGNLGLLYTEQGRLKEAEELHLKALEIRVAALGDTHPDVARSYGALGVVYSKQPAQLAEAKAMHRRALAVRIAAFGCWHPEVARSHAHIGTILFRQGRFALAEHEHRRSLLIRAICFKGRPTPELATSYLKLAEVLRVKGLEEQANCLQRKAELVMARLAPEAARLQ